MLDHKGMREEAVRQMENLQIGIRSMNQAVETLSGGQRQGVAVARAAAWARKLVIMDEPTAALGVKESGQVLELIRRVRDNGLPGDPDQPQHAARVRDRRPDPHPPARQARGRRHAADHTMHEVVGIMTGAVVHDLEHPDQEPGETAGGAARRRRAARRPPRPATQTP